MRFLRSLLCALFLLAAPAAWAQPAPCAATQACSSVVSTQVANNTTAIVIKATAGEIDTVEAFNNGTTIAYVKFYDAATATCGTGTPKLRQMIPGPAGGSGYISNPINGGAFATGIVLCITTGFADADTTAPAASTYIVNVYYR